MMGIVDQNNHQFLLRDKLNPEETGIFRSSSATTGHDCATARTSISCCTHHFLGITLIAYYVDHLMVAFHSFLSFANVNFLLQIASLALDGESDSLALWRTCHGVEHLI